jgi:hypothetical protein
MQTLQQHLDHAHEQLKIPPGALEATHHHAATASTLLSCLRFGGLDDDDIRDYLAVGDPQFVTNWAVKLKRRGSPDARQAAHYLEALTHEQDAELRQAMVMATMALSPPGSSRSGAVDGDIVQLTPRQGGSPS